MNGYKYTRVATAHSCEQVLAATPLIGFPPFHPHLSTKENKKWVKALCFYKFISYPLLHGRTLYTMLLGLSRPTSGMH